MSDFNGLEGMDLSDVEVKTNRILSVGRHVVQIRGDLNGATERVGPAFVSDSVADVPAPQTRQPSEIRGQGWVGGGVHRCHEIYPVSAWSSASAMGTTRPPLPPTRAGRPSTR